MAKNIVMFSDGTGQEGGVGCNTETKSQQERRFA